MVPADALPDGATVAPVLDPGMPAGVGFAVVIARLATTLDEHWDPTLSGGVEDLHDLRIAVRTLRTIVRSGRDVLPRRFADRLAEPLARLAAATGPVRDLDVALADWSTWRTALGGSGSDYLGPLRPLLVARREEWHRELVAVMDAPPVSTLRHLSVSPPRDRRAGEADRLGTVVANRLGAALHRVRSRGQRITPTTSDADLHELRKDAKRLRYLLEAFAEILPSDAGEALSSRLRPLQGALGAHQDTVVHRAELRRLAEEHGHDLSIGELLAIGGLLQLLADEATEARREVVERFAGLDRRSTRRHAERIVSRLTR